MNPPSQPELSLLVFKENLASRTFKIPLSWISRLGILIGGLFVVSAATSFLAVKYYLALRRTDSSQIQRLEEELLALRSSYQDLLESRSKASVTPVTEPATTSSPSPLPVARQAAPAPTAPQASQSFLVGLMPESSLAPPSDPPVSIQSPRISWSGKTLKIRFGIQYARTDGGNQQGRIVILAKGSGAFVSYPPEAFRFPAANDAAQSLVRPEGGEYFSVSRFREVRAELGPLPSTHSIQDVEILLFDTSKQLLLRHSARPSTPSAPASRSNLAPESEPSAVEASTTAAHAAEPSAPQPQDSSGEKPSDPSQ